MALSKTQEAFISKVRSIGNSDLGVQLDDSVCCYLLTVIAHDLGLAHRFPELPNDIPAFFGKHSLAELRIPGIKFLPLFERLVQLGNDLDAYFYCLATLHKARLKYEKILKAQAIPTIEQVGPRGLLQFGSVTPKALRSLLLWRKWIYDIDNRAAQETGYVFEPIIALAIGGVSASAKKSPVKREGSGAGRQVDCVRDSDRRAYEIKLRVTIAASGQGRWREELQFPDDARRSGYTPVLVVLDSTPNDKLLELHNAFKKANGEVYIGAAAWKHLEEKAGETMAKFLDMYVLKPLNQLIQETPERFDELPDLFLRIKNRQLVMQIENENLTIARNEAGQIPSDDVNIVVALVLAAFSVRSAMQHEA